MGCNKAFHKRFLPELRLVILGYFALLSFLECLTSFMISIRRALHLYVIHDESHYNVSISNTAHVLIEIGKLSSSFSLCFLIM